MSNNQHQMGINTEAELKEQNYTHIPAALTGLPKDILEKFLHSNHVISSPMAKTHNNQSLAYTKYFELISAFII